MNLSDHMYQITTMNLLSADITFLQQLFTSLLEPINFQTVLLNIANANISLSLCLAIKQKVKLTNKKSILVKPISKSTNFEYLEKVQIIAESNPLWQLFQKSLITKTPEHHKQFNQFPSRDDEEAYDFDFFELSSKCKKQSSFHCQQNLNWLFLMLLSLKESYNSIQLSDDQIKIKDGICGLRDQLIAKLLTRSLIYYKDANSSQLDLLTIFKFIEQYLPQDDLIIGQKLTNLAKQIVEFLNFDLDDVQRNKFWKKYGKDLSSYTINLYYRFMPLNSAVIVENVIVTLHLLLKQSYNDFVIKDQEEVLNQQEIDIYEQPKEIHRHLYNLRLFIINMLKDASKLTFQAKSQSKVMLNITSILTVLAINLIKKYEQDPLTLNKVKKIHNNSEQQQLTDIFGILETILQKSLNKLNFLGRNGKKDISNNSYEYQIIKNITKILIFHFKYQLKEQILKFICFKYFFAVLQNTKINLNTGSNNAITAIFTFYYKMQPNFKLVNKDIEIIQSTQKIFLLFLQKLSKSNYQEEFTDFEQEKQLCSLNFRGIILFLDEHQKHAYLDQQLSYFSILYKHLDSIFTNNSKTGHYLIRFAIYVASFTKNQGYSYNRQNKFELTLYLIQNLKDSSYKTQFLLLLDFVVDQLVDQDAIQFNEALSYFWYYLSIKKQYSLKDFSNNIAQYLLSFLFTSQQSKLFTYSIRILLKICEKFEKVEQNKNRGQKITNSIAIKKFMPCIYEVFTKLQKSCINNLVQIQQRINFLELTRFMQIQSPSQVYLIYQTLIYQNLNKQRNGNLYFLLDATALLKNIHVSTCRQILFQLMVATLQQNESIINKISLQLLSNDEDAFRVFYLFYKISLDYCKQRHEKHSNQSVWLINLLYEKSALFSQIYDVYNNEQLSELYVSLLEFNMPHLFLPKLPSKIYNTSSPYVSSLILKYIENLNKVQSNEQIIIIFQNIFQRNTLDWKEYQLPEMQGQILSWENKPNVLLNFVDYIQMSKFSVFFDYTELSKQIIIHLYMNFQEKYSQSFLDRSFSIDTLDDEDLVETQPAKGHIDQFFKSYRYQNLLKKIVAAFHNINFIQSEKCFEYREFEQEFMRNAKELLKQQRI